MDSGQPVISIVSPVYRAEKIIARLVDAIHNSLTPMNLPYEIILVDDRSPDLSWEVMQELSAQYSNVISLRLSRNFGQHPAIMAGLTIARGEWVVVMDCDLQDQPQEIVKLYETALQGYEIVLAQRFERRDTFFKRLTSKLFSVFYSYMTDTKFDNSVANFGIYHRSVIAEVLAMQDYIKSFPLFIKWVGFSTKAIPVTHASRDEGKSSYTLAKLLSLAFNTIIAFSNKPLKLFVKFGLLVSLLSFLIGLITIFRYYAGEIKVVGYSSLLVSIWFVFGMLMTAMGIVGIYIGKIFDQSKGRKSFIIEKKINRDV